MAGIGNESIAGNRVSRQRFLRFQRDLQEVVGHAADASLADGAFTTEEIDHFLDRDRDGRVTGADFRLFRNPLRVYHWFRNVQTLYSYKLDQRVARHLSPQDPAFLREDREIVLAAAKFHGSVLGFVDAPFRQDADIVKRALISDLSAHSFIDPQLRRQGSLATHLFGGGYLERPTDRVLGFDSIERAGTAQEREARWAAAKTQLERASVPLPPIMRQSYAAFRAVVDAKYTRFTERIHSVWTAAEILSSRKDEADQHDTRPIALLIYPKSDWNNAFASYPLVDQLVLSGEFRVIYADCADESEVKRVARDLTRRGLHIQTMVLSGHGSSQSLALGGDDLGTSGEGAAPPPFEEAKYIDVSDFQGARSEFQELFALLGPQAQVILYSCSTGQGGAGDETNLANTIARFVPQDVTISSATRAMPIMNADVTDEGLSVTNYDYVTRGRRIRLSHTNR